MNRFDDNGEAQFDYHALLRRREWRERRAELIANSPKCAKCGRSDRPLAAHHVRYEYGRLPWDYPDDAFMIVCNGLCHVEADEDREDAETYAKNSKMYGWQWQIGRKMTKPRDRELEKLASNEAGFRQWLDDNGILREGWDWRVYPMWYLWNQFSNEYLSQKASPALQGVLDL